jgi:hypothetical protein
MTCGQQSKSAFGQFPLVQNLLVGLHNGVPTKTFTANLVYIGAHDASHNSQERRP